jgi:hypothetical protein
LDPTLIRANYVGPLCRDAQKQGPYSQGRRGSPR